MEFTKEELQLIEVALHYQSFDLWEVIWGNESRIENKNDDAAQTYKNILLEQNNSIKEKVSKIDILKKKISTHLENI